MGGPEMAPEVPVTPPPGATGSDIDSLMDELDKISTEILKKGTPKKEPSDSTDSSKES
jgi:hypothetical protein